MGSGRDTKLLLVAVCVLQTLVAPKVSDTDRLVNLHKGTVSFLSLLLVFAQICMNGHQNKGYGEGNNTTY